MAVEPAVSGRLDHRCSARLSNPSEVAWLMLWARGERLWLALTRSSLPERPEGKDPAPRASYGPAPERLLGDDLERT